MDGSPSRARGPSSSSDCVTWRAGSSLRRRLDHHFGERAVYPTRDVDGSDPVKLMLSIEFLRERLAVRGDEIRVVAGHFPLCAVEMIEGRYTTLTATLW